jgi:nucleoside-diphosphate-sugar epimerase
MTKKRVVLVTGSNGFVGQHLVKYLAECGHSVIASSRAALQWDHPNITNVQVPDLVTGFDWKPLLSRCDTVVHLAGIAHRLVDERTYNRINIGVTASVAQDARICGTKQLVFISSIAAQSGSFSDCELTEEDFPEPINAYGRSKLAAENVVRAAGVPFTILRPVVIYGAGEKGNFALIHRAAKMRIPLPFGSLKAPRSVLSIDNFNSAVEFVLTNPISIGETFIVSDPAMISVAEMITAYRAALGRRPNLLQVPEKWVEIILKVIRQGATWQRLGSPLLAPPKKLLRMGWKPVQTTFSPDLASPGQGNRSATTTAELDSR